MQSSIEKLKKLENNILLRNQNNIDSAETIRKLIGEIRKNVGTPMARKFQVERLTKTSLLSSSLDFLVKSLTKMFLVKRFPRNFSLLRI